MFLCEVGSSDARFKKLEFHEGMNLLLADKTEESETGDSRNGAGKSSFARVLRYLLGGTLDKSIKDTQELANHSFWIKLDGTGDREVLVLERSAAKTSGSINCLTFSQEEYSQKISKMFFGFREGQKKPSLGQLLGQLVRNYFAEATKTHNAESDVESGVRIGYLLGFSPEILVKAIEVSSLERQRRELNKAIKTGVFERLDLDEAKIRAELLKMRKKSEQLDEGLKGFRVDRQYAEHQKKADKMSAAIRELNDSAVVLEQRYRDLIVAVKAEETSSSDAENNNQLEVLYREVGVILPEAVSRRFDEVATFHASVVRNRRHFLRSELQSVEQQLGAVAKERTALDLGRSKIMDILNKSMALETFWAVEQEAVEMQAKVSDLEVSLKNAQKFNTIKLDIKRMSVEAESSLRAEMAELSTSIDEAITIFTQLGEEIYRDRNVSLRVEVTPKGVLKITPKIDGDTSAGISEVKTFLLDLVCLIIGIQGGRAPRLLVHDSQLFDSMDDRQLSSCLNIGARLAEEYGFQYIVTLNTDRLEAAEREGFDRVNYALGTTLTDFGDTGGLFGFRFI